MNQWPNFNFYSKIRKNSNFPFFLEKYPLLKAFVKKITFFVSSLTLCGRWRLKWMKYEFSSLICKRIQWDQTYAMGCNVITFVRAQMNTIHSQFVEIFFIRNLLQIKPTQIECWILLNLSCDRGEGVDFKIFFFTAKTRHFQACLRV